MSRSMMLLPAAIFCVVFVFLATTNAMLTHNQPHVVSDIRPILTSTIKFDLDRTGRATNSQHSALSTWHNIESLSTNNINLLSNSAPTSDNQDEFSPLGEEMYFSFELAEAGVQEFFLTVDTSVISSDPQNPTTMTLSTDGSDLDTVYYSKHTTFKGKRMNIDGLEEQIILAIFPNSGDFDSKPTKSIETQSFITPAYTVEGVLLTAKGEIFQISNYNSLIFQYSQQIEQLHSSNTTSAFTEQSVASLSSTLQILEDQQAESTTGLTIVNMNIDKLPGHCAVESDNFNTTTQAPNTQKIQMTPQWALGNWANCHSRSGQTTNFLTRFQLGVLYRMFQSDTNDSTKIDNEKVDARTKLIVSMMNTISYAQHNVNWQISALALGNGSQSWDPISISACTIKDQQSALSKLRPTPSYQDSAVLHGISTCAPYGIVGLSNVANLCQTVGAAYSSYNGLYSVFTILHEQYHAVGANHPFSSDADQGKFGSVMDYNNIRLSDDEGSNDARQYGFSKKLSQKDICEGFEGALSRDITRLFVGSTYVSQSSCWNNGKTTPSSTTAAASDQLCNNDGIVQGHEECDGNNRCCQDCKLANWATCAEESECCEDCIAKPAQTRCTIGTEAVGEKRGYCHRGQCVQQDSMCFDDTMWNCPDSTYHYLDSTIGTCGFICPNTCPNSGGSWSYTFSSAAIYNAGSFCSDKKGNLGVCIGATPFAPKTTNQAYQQLTCQPFVSGEFTWRYVVLQACDCTPSIPTKLIDSYICLDPSGFPVSQTYCEDILKPERQTCACEDANTPFSAPFNITDAQGNPVDVDHPPKPSPNSAYGPQIAGILFIIIVVNLFF